jgi:hypothetical protein
MSLEKAIQENTEAVNKLIAIFSQYVPTSTPAAPAAEEPAKPSRKAKAAAPVETPAADNGTGAEVIPMPAPEPVKPAAPAAPAVSLADLQKLGLLIQSRKADKPEGLERLKGVIADHGAARLSVLPTEVYGEVHAAMQQIIADLGL